MKKIYIHLMGNLLLFGMFLFGCTPNYQLWGATPWNYSHPYWENWANLEWYNKVNIRFLEN